MDIVPLAADDLDEVEPIWSALREHHAEAGLSWIGPVRERADSWARRRADYARWLDEDEGNFVLVARERGRALGYVAVTVGGIPSSTWAIPESAAEIETLALLPEARGAGGGAALVAAARERVRAHGVKRLDLVVLEANDAAVRFYEREGFRPWARIMSAPLDP